MLHGWKQFLLLYLFRYQSCDAYVLVWFISQFWSKILEKSLKIIESCNKIILSKKIVIRGRIGWGGVGGGERRGDIYSRGESNCNILTTIAYLTTPTLIYLVLGFRTFIPLSTNPTKWSNTLKQFVGCCRQIV